jgi:hypothetical protein
MHREDHEDCRLLPGKDIAEIESIGEPSSTMTNTIRHSYHDTPLLHKVSCLSLRMRIDSFVYSLGDGVIRERAIFPLKPWNPLVR